MDDPHTWKQIGENTGGAVYWCSSCGSYAEESYDIELQKYWISRIEHPIHMKEDICT